MQPSGIIIGLISPLVHSDYVQLGYISLGSVHPGPGDVFLSVLPCWHIFERTIELIALSHGTRVVYTNVKQFRSDLATFKPTMLVGVPRLVESLHSSILAKLNSGSNTRRALLNFLKQSSGKRIFSFHKQNTRS